METAARKLGDRFTTEIVVNVSNKERDEKKDELVEVDREIDRIAAEKSAADSEFNQQLKGELKRRTDLLNTIESGTEKQEVEVFERLNDKLGQIETVRVDNGKVLPEFTRALTAEERQLDIMDLDPKGTGKTPPPAKAKGGRKPGPAKGKARGKGRAAAGASAE